MKKLLPATDSTGEELDLDGVASAEDGWVGDGRQAGGRGGINAVAEAL